MDFVLWPPSTQPSVLHDFGSKDKKIHTYIEMMYSSQFWKLEHWRRMKNRISWRTMANIIYWRRRSRKNHDTKDLCN